MIPTAFMNFRFMMIYSIALMLALFEELAFRAFYTAILAVFLMTGWLLWLLVLACSYSSQFLFARLVDTFWHFYRVSRVVKYETLWYSVIFHFVFTYDIPPFTTSTKWAIIKA